MKLITNSNDTDTELYMKPKNMRKNEQASDKNN